MGFRVGIVGLPNVGKSTLFNAVSAAGAESANYPFATIEPNVGIVAVPDPRLEEIARLAESASIVPTSLELRDIAGLVRGASRGEGLGNQFLAQIREVEAIVHVVRCFADGDVVHVDGSVDPLRDMDAVRTELLLKDLETVERRAERAGRAAKSGDRAALGEAERARALLAHLDAGEPVRTWQRDEAGAALVRELGLLTAKPVLYVANVSEATAADPAAGPESAHVAAVRAAAAEEGAGLVALCAQTEAELAELAPAERTELLAELGIKRSGLEQLITAGYELLDLVTFFTTGPKETRAWTVRRGARAPQAAGVIHSDMERGFIRAEVTSYEDFVAFGGEQGARAAGRLRVEGKDYVVADGDVVHVRFNV